MLYYLSTFGEDFRAGDVVARPCLFPKQGCHVVNEVEVEGGCHGSHLRKQRRRDVARAIGGPEPVEALFCSQDKNKEFKSDKIKKQWGQRDQWLEWMGARGECSER